LETINFAVGPNLTIKRAQYEPSVKADLAENAITDESNL